MNTQRLAQRGTPDVDVARIENDNAYRRALADRFVERVGVDIDHSGLRPAIREMFPQLGKRGTESAASKLVGTIATLLVNGEAVDRGARDRGDASGAGRVRGERRSAIAAPASSGKASAGERNGGRASRAPATRDSRVAGGAASPGGGAPHDADAGEPASGASDSSSTGPQVDFGFPSSYGELSARQKRTLEEFCRQRIERGERDANVVLSRVRERYGWPYTKQTFCVGPWRMARQRHRHATELRESAPPLPVQRPSDQPETVIPRKGDPGDGAERIRYSGEDGEFVAYRTGADTWSVEIRATVDREAMQRFQARAFDLMFPDGLRQNEY